MSPIDFSAKDGSLSIPMEKAQWVEAQVMKHFAEKSKPRSTTRQKRLKHADFDGRLVTLEKPNNDTSLNHRSNRIRKVMNYL